MVWGADLDDLFHISGLLEPNHGILAPSWRVLCSYRSTYMSLSIRISVSIHCIHVLIYLFEENPEP